MLPRRTANMYQATTRHVRARSVLPPSLHAAGRAAGSTPSTSVHPATALVTAAAATLTIGTATVVGRGNPLRAFSSSRTLLCDEQKPQHSLSSSSSSSGLLSSLSSSLPSISTDTFKFELPGMPALPDFGSTVKSWTKSLGEWTDKLRVLQDELTGEKGSLVSNVLERGKDVNENPEIQWDAKVRLGNDLSMVERGFLRARREAVKPAFCRLMGLSENEVHIDDIPLVAVAGSGGGYRAMINTLGSIQQAKSSGLWDVVAYASAVSGSCWALNALYSVGNGDINTTLDHIKARIETPFLDPESLSLLTTKPTSEYLLSGAVLKQNSKAGEITIVDAYGTLVSGRLFVPTDLGQLSNRHLKLSSQRDFVDSGKHPLPIYCTIRHELPDTKAKEIEEKKVESKEAKTASEREDARKAKNELVKQGSWMWFEITPYEVGCDEVGAWIPTWSLGRLFENGKSVERIPELSLSILSGIFASAFCATLYSYYNEIRPILIAAPFASQIQQFAEDNQARLDSIHPFPPAELPNFLKGLEGKLKPDAPATLSKLDTLGFMDAGANLNIPYNPLFRRDCDLIIALDASADSQDIWFNRAAEYAEKAQLSSRWPSVDVESLFPKDDSSKQEAKASDAASKVDQAKAQEENAAMTSPAPRAAQPNNPQRPPVGSGPHSKETSKDIVGSDTKPVPKSQGREPPLEKCSIWIGSTDQEKGQSCRKDYPTVQDVADRDGIALAYIPLRGKIERELDEGEDGAKSNRDGGGKLEKVDVAEVWSTWRFEYKPQETDKLVELSRSNFAAGEDQIKTVIRGLYERKKRQRLQDPPLNAQHASTGAVKPTMTSTRRVELRAANLTAWDRQGPPEGLGKLDPSLKRHTTLLNKLKTQLNVSAGAAAIVKEIGSLSLERHIEEAVGAVGEGLLKCKTATEVMAAAEVISALHQRFPEQFTIPFNQQLLQSMKVHATNTSADKDVQEKDDQSRVIKQRGLLRVLAELELIGIVKKVVPGEITFSTFKELLTADKEQLALAAPLAISFAKHLGPYYLPSAPANEDSNFPALSDGAASVTTDDEIVPRELKEKFSKLLVAYYDALGRKEVRNNLELQKIDKRNHEAYIRSGEIFEDREKNYEKAVKAWERGWASITQLSELLGVPVPALPTLASNTVGAVLSSGPTSFFQTEEVGGPGSLWIDEEDKAFYEDLRDLQMEVPANFLGITKGGQDQATDSEIDTVKEREDTAEAVADAAKESDQADADVKEEPVVTRPEGEDAEASVATGPAAQLTALLARLPEASSRATIDKIAVDFAFLNSKAARKRLVKTLAAVPRSRSDLLPYYSRLVGTLNPYMPDVGKELVALLEDEFRYLQKKKNVDLAETRAKNLRFLSELTKFKITPTHVILHVLKVLTDDFSGPNIDNLCTVLEGCGRFLLRTESTHEKMRAVLETVKRKKAATLLDARQTMMLDNAYYQCDPPDRPVMAQKERTPMQLYIKHLFYNQLTRNTSDRILKLVRKLHWEDPAIVRKLHNCFVKVWKIKYSNIHLFAVLLYDLGRYHPDFSVSVIDDVLENIRIGMERNNFKYNQQRVATARYLGELYNYRVVDSRVVFDTLWSFVTLGHPDGRPHPDAPTPIDSPTDYFRIRLVCVLLDTCGSCFERGTLRKKLDNFLLFFQMYILTKSHIPMDIGFAITDTFEQLRPKMVRLTLFDEAAAAVDEMMAAVARSGPAEEEADDGAEDEAPRQVKHEDDSDDESVTTTESEGDDDTVGPDDEQDDPEDHETDAVGRGRDPNAMTQDDQDEFDRELAKMLSSTSETRKLERKGGSLADVGVPFVKRSKHKDEEDDFGSGDAEGVREPPKDLKFMVLTKKGQKQQTMSVDIPIESSIAMHTLEKRAQDKAEQQHLKKLVLDYEERAEESEKQALKDTLANRGITLNYKSRPMKVIP
ncbi:mRNA decay protein [Microbotryomycetes sp. JL201]|nr:mRNA decay protein [Microbotryomycetes sp. JL201]